MADEKKIRLTQPELIPALRVLVEPFTRGDPESGLMWTSKSTYHLRDELVRQGYTISQPQVGKFLRAFGYSLQAPRKIEEGGTHPDRDAQFQYIARHVSWFVGQGWPVISVDGKKKEPIGAYTNVGSEYRPHGEPERVRVYDFVDPAQGKVVPYGSYDRGGNEGFVNVGISADTAEFAVNSIQRWWELMGQRRYSGTLALLITADGGGSNSSRGRLWKVELQRFANALRLHIHVCHYPPGTSKWNPIEHRMFAFISKNWRGRPLTSRESVVQLISHTTTVQGLRIQAQLDERVYQTGKRISDKELAQVKIERATFHGEWNYIIHPI